jgi:serine/threonine protein kinase
MVDGFGRIHLIDFGIATMGAESACAGRSFGTLAYMAPEQIMQEPLDGRTDQFALGALLYELVTGQRLFPENTIKNMAMSRIQTLATPLAKKGGWGFCTPLRALLQLLKQCVMVNPSDRFQNIEVLSTRLHKVQRRVRKDASLQTWIEHQIKQQTLDFDAPCAE